MECRYHSIEEEIMEVGLIAQNSINQDKSIFITDIVQENQNNQGIASESNRVDIVDRPQQLGKDEFLRLLVTQLTYQDPTAPIKDQEFIAQMAQFSSLEQMQNVSRSMQELSNQQSQSLLGKIVVGTDIYSGKSVSGEVEKISFDPQQRAMLHIGEAILDPKNIFEVSPPTARPVIGSDHSGLMESSRETSGSIIDTKK